MSVENDRATQAWLQMVETILLDWLNFINSSRCKVENYDPKFAALLVRFVGFSRDDLGNFAFVDHERLLEAHQQIVNRFDGDDDGDDDGAPFDSSPVRIRDDPICV